MKKLLYTILLTGIFAGAFIASSASPAFADCQEIYGGTQTCTTSYTFTVEKLVQVPGKGGGNFVNNLSINDAKYAPGQDVNFEILVTNTSSQTISSLTVTDAFPQYVTYVSGPGTYNANANTLTFTLQDLGAGETRTYNVTGQIAGSSSLPSDQGTICLINKATGTDNNGTQNSSSSQFCVEQSVLGTSTPQVYSTTVTTTPATGPEMLPLMALIPGGLGGFVLRKKAIKK